MAKTPEQLALANWQDERNTTYLYEHLARIEKEERIADIYQRMAVVELKHAEKWAEQLRQADKTIPEFHPSRRTRILAWLAQRLGAGFILPSMQAMEQSGTSGYAVQAESKKMAGEERSHARMLSQIARGGIGGSALAQLEGRHRATGGNALRAAVLGANDGLVSNLSLVMGVAGAAMANQAILITGIAGLLAGAASMALGEWLSVQSSRELYENQIRIEKLEIEQAPEEEAEELALIYEARGLSREQAITLAKQLTANKEQALDTLAREELGVNPEELGGSAWVAAITSFILFALGAIVPVIPFTFLSGMTAVVVSIAFSTVALFIIGSVITLFTGRTILYSGMRMVIFGLLAAALTYAIGSLIGVSLAG
jgi:VIT1/CCC1 family predicted Fe2+/Mn2+ transporter